MHALALPALLALAACASPGRASTPAPDPARIAVARQVDRQRDGKKYPLPVMETYRLERDGQLRYFAYFGDMPLEMNHVDGIDWPAGDPGRRVRAEVAALLADRRRSEGLVKLPEDGSLPAGEEYFAVRVETDGSTVTFVATDRRSPAFRALEAAFAPLIAAFEKATGRPLDPGRLPQ